MEILTVASHPSSRHRGCDSGLERMTEPRGYALKLLRAKDHIQAITADVHRWINEDIHAVLRKDDPESDLWIVEWTDSATPPLMWGAMIGDFIHNVCSALDHLLYDLVIANTQRPGTRTSFPIASQPSDWMNFVGREGGPPWAGASPEVIEAIQELQPYKLTSKKARRTHPLAVMRPLSNTDKHRVIHIARMKLAEKTLDFPKRIELIPPDKIRFTGLKWKPTGTLVQPGTEVARLHIHARTPLEEDVDVNLQVPLRIVVGQRGKAPDIDLTILESIMFEVAYAIDLLELVGGLEPLTNAADTLRAVLEEQARQAPQPVSRSPLQR